MKSITLTLRTEKAANQQKEVLSMNWQQIIPFIICFILIAVCVLAWNRKNQAAKDQYDERQEMLRKNAYKYSAMTMLFCSLAYYIVTVLVDKPFAQDGVSVLLIALAGVAVFALYSIFNDAFFGVKGRRSGTGRPVVYIILVAFITVMNGISAVRMIREKALVKDGLLTTNVMNLALTILFLLILIAFAVKYIMNTYEDRRADG